MNITKNFVNESDKTCIQRQITVPLDEIKTIDYDCGKEIDERCKEKYFGMIKEDIPEDEKIIYCYTRIWCNEKAIFEVTTREYWRINKEKEMAKLLTENGFMDEDEYSYSEINIRENNWIELRGLNVAINKQNMKELTELLNVSDWEVIHDWHMEECYLKIRGDIEWD